jgi:hypothetical protein
VAVTTFLGDLLEHFLVQQQLGDEQLEALDLGLQLPEPTGLIELGRIVLLTPAIVGVLGDPELAAHVGDGEPFGQVTFGFPKQPHDWVGGPSLAQESLLDLTYL